MEPNVSINGVTAASELEMWSDEEILRSAVKYFDRHQLIANRKLEQSIKIDGHKAVCLACLGDQHLGSAGVDYRRMEQEYELIRHTPGMYAITIGDLVDNYIVGKLQSLNFEDGLSTHMQWRLAGLFIEKIAPKLLITVSGNHDLWFNSVTGTDGLAGVHAEKSPLAIYDKHQVYVTITVGQSTWTILARHQFKGSSIYNPTHAIERAAKFGGLPFDIGIAGHTHVSGLCREFNHNGKSGWAIQVGTYKRIDSFARQINAPVPNNKTVVPLILHSDGYIVYPDNLSAAVGVLEAYNR